MTGHDVGASVLEGVAASDGHGKVLGAPVLLLRQLLW